jgi:hypothetical protein
LRLSLGQPEFYERWGTLQVRRRAPAGVSGVTSGPGQVAKMGRTAYWKRQGEAVA